MVVFTHILFVLIDREDIHFDEFLLMAAKKEACEDSKKELKEAFKVSITCALFSLVCIML